MHKHKIWKKGLVFIVILLFIGMSVVPSTATIIQEKSIIPTNNDNTLYVGGSGPDNYTKIQDAINDANSGDTVFVYNDSSPYYENLNINKSINLIAENNNTKIISESNNRCVNINSDDVTIKGFRIISNYSIKVDTQTNIIIQNNIIESNNNNKSGEGIDIDSSKFCFILGNEIYGFNSGIYMHVTQDVNIFNNNIYDNGYGLFVPGGIRLNISNNIISNNLEDGILIYYADYPIFYNNTITFNERGIYSADGESPIYKNNKISYNKECGLYSSFDKNRVIIGNIVSYNVGCGIESSYNDSIISNNIIFNNKGDGIDFSGDYNDILDNHIENNTGYGIISYSRASNIERNNLINNHINAYFVNLGLLLNLYVGYIKPSKWNANYYSDIGSKNSYIIHGKWVSLFIIIRFPWFTIDHNPAKEPYDIS